jgi:hypothetical protein
MPAATPLGLPSGKQSSAMGCCQAILRWEWEGQPRCAQQL